MKKCFIQISSFLVLFLGFCTDPLHAEELKNCAFCQEDVLGRQVFYRGHDVFGLTTHKPAVKGHVLIIPQRHVERFEDLTPIELAEMGSLIRKINLASQHLYGTTGYLLVQKNGREAGQTVPHVHFHYLPVKEGDSQVMLAIKFFVSPWLPALKGEEMAPEILALSNEIERSY